MRGLEVPGMSVFDRLYATPAIHRLLPTPAAMLVTGILGRWRWRFSGDRRAPPCDGRKRFSTTTRPPSGQVGRLRTADG